MIGLSWNCRGIKKKGVSSSLRNLILEHRFNFVCLQETIQESIEDKTIRKIDPNQSYLWKWLPSIDKLGGLLMGVSTSNYDVGSFREGEFMLELCLWDKEQRRKWNLINAYGAAQDDRKESFLTELTHFCSRNKEPYLICGDFNIIRYPSEKNKKTTLKRFSRMFNTIIDAYELIDIDMMDGKFTWSNNQNPPPW
jgi:exonuclease III